MTKKKGEGGGPGHNQGQKGSEKVNKSADVIQLVSRPKVSRPRPMPTKDTFKTGATFDNTGGLLAASQTLYEVIQDIAPGLALDELAGLFALYARDLAELSLLEEPDSIEKSEKMRILKRTLCECVLAKSPTLGRFTTK